MAIRSGADEVARLWHSVSSNRVRSLVADAGSPCEGPLSDEEGNMHMKRSTLIAAAGSLALLGCGDAGQQQAADAGMDGAGGSVETSGPNASAQLEAVLAAQPDDVRARYQWRHPQETLTLFRVEPGQTVVEALPGGGWYTKILLPYLGANGKLIGADYEASMWPKFGFMDEAAIEERRRWPEQWPDQVAAWGIEDAAAVEAYTLGTLPESLTGQVDRVLFIRALHNLARFEDDGGYLTRAVEESMRVLKPGGLVGVVQHRAPNDAPDEWANGSAGYLKKAFVMRTFLKAGFLLEMESGINRNRDDQPTTDDVVWRLPPSLRGSGEDPELRARMQGIGESDRMTLVFRKPVAGSEMAR